jgi:hypothetical protein
MDRRGFLKNLIGGVAAAAAVRTFPFRVFSFPKEIKLPDYYKIDWPVFQGELREGQYLYDRVTGIYTFPVRERLVGFDDLISEMSKPVPSHEITAAEINQIERDLAEQWNRFKFDPAFRRDCEESEFA